ncbi:MAG: hypothetical protein PHO27_02425 [Sulfuricurvum sp.]|nr:hypothetical protein [Sulfuricurvum sp.]
MRTALFLLNGFLLLGFFYLLIKLFTPTIPTIRAFGACSFLIIWLAISITNMTIGIMKAGYGIGEEFSIFLLIFLIPSLTGYWLWLKHFEI